MQAIFGTILTVLCAFQITNVHGGSFVPSISEQWPWRQWTTTTKIPPTTTSTTTETVTQTPVIYSAGNEEYEEEQEDSLAPSADYLIVTDPNTGKSFTVPSTIFWSKLGNYVPLKPRITTTTTQAPLPRKSVICDFYLVNCWNPRQSYGSNFRQRTYSGRGETANSYDQTKGKTATISTLYGLGIDGPRLLGNQNNYSKGGRSPYWKRELINDRDESETTTLMPLIRVTRPSEYIS